MRGFRWQGSLQGCNLQLQVKKKPGELVVSGWGQGLWDVGVGHEVLGSRGL
jgi:hypothetical protein